MSRTQGTEPRGVWPGGRTNTFLQESWAPSTPTRRAGSLRSWLPLSSECWPFLAPFGTGARPPSSRSPPRPKRVIPPQPRGEQVLQQHPSPPGSLVPTLPSQPQPHSPAWLLSSPGRRTHERTRGEAKPLGERGPSFQEVMKAREWKMPVRGCAPRVLCFPTAAPGPSSCARPGQRHRAQL